MPIFVYQLSQFEATSYIFFEISLLQVFKDQIGRGQQLNKNKITFFYFAPGNLLIILYSLTMFEAPICYSFWDIMITKLHSDPLKGALLNKGR